MIKSFVILPLILLGACRSTRGASVGKNQDLVKTPAAPAQVLLQKIVGRLPEDSQKSQIFDCKVSSDQVDDLNKVQTWINEVTSAPLVEAYLFRAADPSIEIFAFQGDKRIQIFEYASMRKYPKPNDAANLKNAAAEELFKIINEKCPSPK